MLQSDATTLLNEFEVCFEEKPRGSGLIYLTLIKRFTHNEDVEQFISKLEELGLNYFITNTSRNRKKVGISRKSVIYDLLDSVNLSLLSKGKQKKVKYAFRVRERDGLRWLN